MDDKRCKFAHGTKTKLLDFSGCLLCGSNARMVPCDGIEGKKDCPFWNNTISIGDKT